jgi:predicted nucleotidyltransferase
MSERLTSEPVPLRNGDTPAWQLWAQVARLAQHLQPTDWVLVGGQMVALHCHIAGVTPGRATIDIDIVANVLVNPNALFACRSAAAALDLEPQPSANNRRQHRFRNDNLVLDVMVPDHMPKHMLLRMAGREPVPIAGGYRALQRAAQCDISTEAGEAIVPIPDMQGALVLKARAYIADSRDRGRHQFDLAQLCAAIDDPITLAGTLDNKELRALRKVDMPLAITQDPWLRLDAALRPDAVEAWETLITDTTHG